MPPVTDDSLISPPTDVGLKEAEARNLEQSAAALDRIMNPQAQRDPRGRFTPTSTPEPKAPTPEPVDEQPKAEAAPTEAAEGDGGEEEVFEIDLGDGNKHTLSASELAELVGNRGKKPQETPQPAAPSEDVVRARNEVETERARIRQERNYYAQQLAQFVPQAIRDIEAAFPDIKTPADQRKLAVDDPARYVQFIAMRDTIVAAQQDQQRLYAQAQAEQSAAMEKYVSEQVRKLHEVEPVFADPVKGPTERRALHSYLVKQGFSADELEGLVDHRTVVVARKAMLYDAAQAAKPTDKRVAPVLRSIRPGAARAPQQATAKGQETRAAAIQNLQKTGTLDAAAAAFRAMGIR